MSGFRCMSHRFNRTTHRCVRCDRWQTGFAPKREPVKHRAECQVCEREQACDKDGTLGHHGYVRKGIGFIYGDCFGEGFKPYPDTTALVLLLQRLDGMEANMKKQLAALEAGAVAELPFTYAPDAWDKRHKITIRIPKGEPSRYDNRAYITIPSFDSLAASAMRGLKSQLSLLPAERQRITARIARAATVTV